LAECKIPIFVAFSTSRSWRWGICRHGFPAARPGGKEKVAGNHCHCLVAFPLAKARTLIEKAGECDRALKCRAGESVRPTIVATSSANEAKIGLRLWASTIHAINNPTFACGLSVNRATYRPFKYIFTTNLPGEL